MTVTLETLRADFEHHKLWDECDDKERMWRVMRRDYPNCYRYPSHSPGFVGTVYLLACEFGLNAAMLYKLSDGAIDPRKDGGE